MRSILIGITGRSCSGKSTLAKELFLNFKERAQHLDLDKFISNSADFNCEKPSDFENVIIANLETGLRNLKQGNPAYFSTYDCYRRKVHKTPVKFDPAEIVIIEGCLLFWPVQIRNLIDFKVFIDTPDNICLQRRLERGLKNKRPGERFYLDDEKSIRLRWKVISQQWDIYLEPMQKFADLILTNSNDNKDRLIQELNKKKLFID